MSDYTLEGILRLTDKTGEGTRSASRNVDGLSGALKAAEAALVSFGVVKVLQVVGNLAQLGAQVKRTEYAFENISGGEEEAAANLEAMRTATRGAMSDQEAMRLSNRLLQMDIANSSQELETLTEMAVRLGGAMGKDAASAVEEFSLLIANKAKLRFDTFGISVSGVEERIEKLQRTTRGLSEDEIFLQAVMEEGGEAMERLGDPVDDHLLKLEQARATWQNFKDTLGETYSSFVLLSEPFQAVVKWATRQLEVLGELTDKYGEFEGRLKAIVSILTLGAFNARENTFFGASLTSPEQYFSNWYNQGQARLPGGTQGTSFQGSGGMSSQSVTMYGVNINGVSSPQDLLGQLQGLTP